MLRIVCASTKRYENEANSVMETEKQHRNNKTNQKNHEKLI